MTREEILKEMVERICQDGEISITKDILNPDDVVYTKKEMFNTEIEDGKIVRYVSITGLKPDLSDALVSDLRFIVYDEETKEYLPTFAKEHDDEVITKVAKDYGINVDGLSEDDWNLLLEDLCFRLKDGVMVEVVRDGSRQVAKLTSELLDEFVDEKVMLRPFLRRMDEVTKEEKKEYDDLMMPLKISVYSEVSEALLELRFYHKHHLDYRGLLEKGLALSFSEELSQMDNNTKHGDTWQWFDPCE